MMSELCDWCMAEGTAHKKASTLYVDKGRVERHIKLLLGNIPVKEITRGMVEKYMYDVIKGDKIRQRAKSANPRGVTNVKGGKYAAGRSVSLLGAIFEFARSHNLIETNPAHGIKKPADNKKDVFLTLHEMGILGEILRLPAWVATQKTAINAIKLLLLTGCRKDEILSLRWEYVDFAAQCFRFPDTKTGKQNRPFGLGALHLLQGLAKHKTSLWVFPASTGSGYYVGLPHAL